MNKYAINFTKKLAAAFLVAGFSASVHANGTWAKAEIRLCSNNDVLIGSARLWEKESTEGIKKVNVVMQVWGLTPGRHAVHIHETGNCQPCSAALGHFDPGPVGFTSPDGNHPFHSGDLVNIESQGGRYGRGLLWTSTTRITLSDGPLSLFDEDGSAFIIHDNEDTFCPDGDVPGCAGGSRFACGIIKRKS